MNTLIIIPAYNEAENLPAVLADLHRFCPEAIPLIVNDCSTDDTPSILSGLGVDYLSLPVNLGIGGGVQTGYRYALANGYDVAVQFDGDGQHMAEYIHALLEPLEEGRADFVVGSRFLEKEGFQSSAMRRIGIRFLSRLIYRLCGLRVLDVTSGMRAVNREMIAFFAEHYAQDYPEPEAILSAGLQGARILEAPVRMRERQGGKSTINPLRSAYYMVKVTLALLLNGMFGGRRHHE
jgi:glycosyltransferase involved in cell wall biosynthesis